MPSALDIAKEAKVSPSTVSLALNHPDRVHPETFRRVEEAMERLKFQPRPLRRITTPSDRLHVAFVYSLDTTDRTADFGMSGYCRELIEGVKSNLGDSWSLNVVRGTDHIDDDLIFCQQLDAKEFNGAMLFGPHDSDGYLERFKAAGIPLVVFNHMTFCSWFSSVNVDYYGAVQQVISHLAKLGHRRLACFGFESAKWSVQQIHEGLQRGAAEFGCELIDIDGKMNPYFLEQSTEGIRADCQKALDKKATAFFTGDALAVQMADMLEEMGLSVPADISVIGFDDRHLTTKRGLKLTSVGYDRQHMGRMAIQILQQMIEGSDKLRCMSASTTTFVFEGQTCGPAKG